MKKRLVLLVILTILAVVFWFSSAREYVTFETLKENRRMLQQFVSTHYLSSVLLFILFFVSTAFFVPGAIAATVTGGFLFGTVRGAIYVNVGSVTGAALAFLLSRYLIGEWIQRRYRRQLQKFNNEIEHYGHNYLFVLRIVPVLPFFVVNYLAGLTRMSLKRFIVTTSLTMLPGSLIYTFAGQQLSHIEKPEDILSAELLIAFALLGLFALLPIFKRLFERRNY